MLKVEVSAKDRHEIKTKVVEHPSKSVQELEVLQKTPANAVVLVDGLKERTILEVT